MERLIQHSMDYSTFQVPSKGWFSIIHGKISLLWSNRTGGDPFWIASPQTKGWHRSKWAKAKLNFASAGQKAYADLVIATGHKKQNSGCGPVAGRSHQEVSVLGSAAHGRMR